MSNTAPLLRELADSYLSRAQGSVARLDDCRIRTYEDHFFVATEFHRFYASYLVGAKMQWRHNLADPRTALREALALARRATKLLAGLKKKDFGKQRFQFASAAALAYLLEGKFDRSLVRMFPDIAAWKEAGERMPWCYTEAGVIMAMERKRVPTQWDEMLQATKNQKKKFDLRFETYRCYMEIIRHALASDHKAAAEAVKKACQLYERRNSDNNCTSFELDDGCGPSTGNVVEHRLSAILKFCFKNPAASLKDERVVHLWAYDAK